MSETFNRVADFALNRAPHEMPDSTREAAALMRVNHVGEVCAQALYQAQALSTNDPRLREQFERAAREETDHLAWTRTRIDELGDRRDGAVAGQLQRLGADIRTTGHHAVVRGVDRLIGTDVVAHDIRAGAAMVVAGLAAAGTTTIRGVHHIDRGYDDLVGRLRSVGADIERTD